MILRVTYSEKVPVVQYNAVSWQRRQKDWRRSVIWFLNNGSLIWCLPLHVSDCHALFFQGQALEFSSFCVSLPLSRGFLWQTTGCHMILITIIWWAYKMTNHRLLQKHLIFPLCTRRGRGHTCKSEYFWGLCMGQ